MGSAKQNLLGRVNLNHQRLSYPLNAKNVRYLKRNHQQPHWIKPRPWSVQIFRILQWKQHLRQSWQQHQTQIKDACWVKHRGSVYQIVMWKYRRNELFSERKKIRYGRFSGSSKTCTRPKSKCARLHLGLKNKLHKFQLFETFIHSIKVFWRYFVCSHRANRISTHLHNLSLWTSHLLPDWSKPCSRPDRTYHQNQMGQKETVYWHSRNKVDFSHNVTIKYQGKWKTQKFGGFQGQLWVYQVKNPNNL